VTLTPFFFHLLAQRGLDLSAAEAFVLSSFFSIFIFFLTSRHYPLISRGHVAGGGSRRRQKRFFVIVVVVSLVFPDDPVVDGNQAALLLPMDKTTLYRSARTSTTTDAIHLPEVRGGRRRRGKKG
jgi:hypothetical protein